MVVARLKVRKQARLLSEFEKLLLNRDRFIRTLLYRLDGPKRCASAPAISEHTTMPFGVLRREKRRNREVFLVGLALLVVEFPLALAFRAPGIKEGPLVRTKDRVDSIRQALLNRLALRPPFLS